MCRVVPKWVHLIRPYKINRNLKAWMDLALLLHSFRDYVFQLGQRIILRQAKTSVEILQGCNAL